MVGWTIYTCSWCNSVLTNARQDGAMKWVVFLVAAFVFGLLPLRAHALFSADASGTYVGSATNAAFLLQMVETSDGRVTGRYEQVLVRPDGTFDALNAAITGATDGQTVVLTLRPNGLLTESITASGTFDGSRLHLTGTNALALNLQKSDEAHFRNQVALLAGWGRQIKEARAREEARARAAKFEADFLNHVRDLTQRMNSLVMHTDARLKAFASDEQRYRAITERMRKALAREQSIYGDGQRAVARSQISVWMSQAEIASNQIHIAVDNSAQNFKIGMRQLTRDVIDTAQGCHRANSESISAGTDDYNSVCLALLHGMKAFQEESKALETAYAHVESVWNNEHGQQVELLHASEIAAR